MRRLDLAERVIELRERADLTQEEAAKKAGVGVTTWSNIETGTITRPHARTVIKIARALGVDPEALTAPKADAPPSPEPERAQAEERREPSLLPDPRIVALLREWGYETDEEYKDAFGDFDLGIDEEGMPRGLERVGAKLQEDFSKLLRELHKPANYKTLFPERASFSKADEDGDEHIQVLRASYASKLRREVRRIYERRFRALESFSEALYDAGRTRAFLVPKRRLNVVKAARERALAEAFEGQQAG